VTAGTPIAFKLPRFYPILDTVALADRGFEPMHVAEVLVATGVRILQYRHKDSWTQRHFDEAKQIANLCYQAGVLFVMNDRADYARLLGAALHVGQDDLSPVAARRVVSDEVIGFSTHNKAQLERGNGEPVEYLSIGPIANTRSKLKPDPVVGLEGLRSLRSVTAKPLVAIGGIDLLNARNVLAAGADSVAVISGLFPEAASKKALKRRAEEWMQLLAV
jgi:thiamine-phosphate pyrophosphorylase